MHYPPRPFAGFHVETVTLHGQYGNVENNLEALPHCILGQQQASKVRPLDLSGNPPADGSGAIVAVFMGFSIDDTQAAYLTNGFSLSTYVPKAILERFRN
jgi:hypothetical protein